MYSNFEQTYNSYLMHHGTKGMKWGLDDSLLDDQLCLVSGVLDVQLQASIT